MLSYVAPSDRVESLENHILRRAGPPTNVGGFDASARQPSNFANLTSLPGPKAPLRASSARPGKMTNQHIPYVRIMQVFPSGLNPVVNQDVTQGQVVFVNRKVHEGVGTNRTSKMCNVDQMNAVLDDHSERNRGKTFMSEDDQSPYTDPFLTWEERWKACSEVQSWLPDGVVLTAEHQHERPYQNVGSVNSNPGEGFNVVVQGPVACARRDMKFTFLDVVHLCLFRTEHAGDGTPNRKPYISFRWELLSRSDIDRMRDTEKGKERLNRMASQWKIGKVLDPLASPDDCTVNVCIEEERGPWNKQAEGETESEFPEGKEPLPTVSAPPPEF